MNKNVIILGTVLVMSGLVAAQKTAVVQEKLNEVALFKNGLCFFISQVQCPVESTEFTFVPTLAPNHGTFWVTYPEELKLVSMKAKTGVLSKTENVGNIAELVESNVGSNATITVRSKDYTGVIISILKQDKPEKPEPFSFNAASMMMPPPPQRDNRQGMVIFSADEGTYTFNLTDVEKVFFPGQKINTKIERETDSAELLVKIGKPASGENLTVSYMARGITWAPSYMIDISDLEKATLTAKAVVINSACDLNNVRLGLVTGSPNFMFSDIWSPLSLKYDVLGFLQALTQDPETRMRGRRGIVTQQRADVFSNSAFDLESIMPAYGAAAAGEQTEDLFFYPVDAITLAKDEVAYLPLFTDCVEYEHVYTWDIPNYFQNDDRYRYNNQPEQEEAQQEVFHCIKIKNAGELPWTTAPIEVISGKSILAQDMLKYTPIGGETKVKITRAVNVAAEQKETEVERQRQAARFNGSEYDLVTVKGELVLKNHQNKTIKAEITKKISGEVENIEPQAQVDTQATILASVNTRRTIKWIEGIEPNGQLKLGYTYKVYVR